MILGIDQGTTGSTAVLLSPRRKVLGTFTSAVPQHFPKPGWVEHDAEEIWQSVKNAVTGVLAKTRTSPKRILAIGITNQRETVSLFEGSRALHRFIVWQDRRTAPECKALEPHAKVIRKIAGLPVDPYFSSTKIRWLTEKLKLSKNLKDIRFRTIDSFLLNRMTGEDVIEITNASRTSLMNLKMGHWDEKLLKIFQIPEDFCPRQILPSEGFSLKTRKVGFLPDGIPIVAALGDQQAALFGQIGWRPGSGKITFGTGSFILLNTGSTIPESSDLVATVALQWGHGQKVYALEGSAFICGAWIQFLKEQLGLIKDGAESERLAKKVKDSGGVMVIPALSGMGAPFWKPNLRGCILGLTRGSRKEHLVRASYEALCFQNRALIEAMSRNNLKPQWKVDGGVVRNNTMMQIQADVLQSTIIRPKNLEASGIGAALMAAFSRKLLGLKEIEKAWKSDRVFKPSANSYDEIFETWKDMISKMS